MARSIGGVLDLHALRLLHRPHDPAALAAEARRLAREQHLSPRDIAQAIGLSITDVHEALRTAPAEDRP